jgi:alpha-mannosidase
MKTSSLLATLVFAASACVAEADDAPAVNPKVKEIIVIFKTHFDIGYTHRARDIVSYYRTGMVDHALELMEKSKDLPKDRQFAWTGPGWVMDKLSEDWPGQTPERRRKIETGFKNGRFVVHALPFTVEADLMDPETLARGYESASRVARRFGLPLSRSGKCTDVPSQGNVYPTVLAHGGVTFMHIGCNWPAGKVTLPPLYWWEGPDGSRVLTLYSAFYGTTLGMGYPFEWASKREFPHTGRNLVPPASTRDWPYTVWPAICVSADNSGPPTPEMVRDAFAEVEKKMPGVKVRVGTLDDFARAILKLHPDLPVVKAEAPDSWAHGCMCDPDGTRIARDLQMLAPAAEVLDTQTRLMGLAGETTDEVGRKMFRAYELMNLFGEHTWGGSLVLQDYGAAFQEKAGKGEYKNLQDTWNDKTAYITDAQKIVTGLMKGRLEQLAQMVKSQPGDVVVYNPLPWVRSGAVDGGTFITNVPACGYKVIRPEISSQRKAAAPSKEPVAIENEFFRVTLDPRSGTVASLRDKRTGREWIGQAQGIGYLNERFTYEQTVKYATDYEQGRGFQTFGASGDWPHPGMHKPGLPSETKVPYRAASPAGGVVSCVFSGDGNEAVVEMPAAPANHLPASQLRVSLPAGQPFVDIVVTIKDKPRDNWPEADWLCLPFNITSPSFTVGRSLGTLDPSTILPGADRDILAVGTGVMLTGADGSGMVVIPLDHPLVSLDRPGCWKASQTAADFTPKKPVVYLNLYNNQWNTNYRYWYEGTWSSRVRLRPFDEGTAVGDALVTPAMEARLPLMALAAQGGAAGTLPKEKSGVSVSRPGVLVTAFGKNPDGAGTLLRVWEQAGKSGELVVTIPGQFTTAKPVNLRGEKTGEPVPVRRGKLTVDLSAYAPASFVLE